MSTELSGNSKKHLNRYRLRITKKQSHRPTGKHQFAQINRDVPALSQSKLHVNYINRDLTF